MILGLLSLINWSYRSYRIILFFIVCKPRPNVSILFYSDKITLVGITGTKLVLTFCFIKEIDTLIQFYLYFLYYYLKNQISFIYNYF